MGFSFSFHLFIHNKTDCMEREFCRREFCGMACKKSSGGGVKIQSRMYTVCANSDCFRLSIELRTNWENGFHNWDSMHVARMFVERQELEMPLKQKYFHFPSVHS